MKSTGWAVPFVTRRKKNPSCNLAFPVGANEGVSLQQHVGRCADFVLKDYLKVLKRKSSGWTVTAFISMSTMRERNGGEPHRYHLMLNTGVLDLKNICKLVKGVYQGLEKA